MKKKLSLILCLAVMALCFISCGSDDSKSDYYGTSYEELQNISENNIASLATITDEEYEYYVENGSDLVSKLVSSWRDTTSDLGAYQGMGAFSVSKAQTTVTTEQTVYFEQRNAIFTLVYEYSYTDEALELSDVNVDLVYTMGEKMQKAGLNTLMGMGTVFIVLILISLIIYCFRFISVVENRNKKKNEPAAPTVDDIKFVPDAPAYTVDDAEIAAAITAAIAYETGESTDSFIVRSIVRR